MSEMQAELIAGLDSAPGEVVDTPAADPAPAEVSQDAGAAQPTGAPINAPAASAEVVLPQADQPPAAQPEGAPGAPAVSTDRTVPLGELIAERKRLQAAVQAARDEGAEALNQLRQELAAIKGQINKAEAPPEQAPPDFLEDPKGYIDAAVAKAEAAARKTAEAATETSHLTQQQVAQREFINTLASTEAAFAAKNPDYYDAVEHLRQSEIADLQEMYKEAPKDAIIAQVNQNHVAMALAAMRQGISPAEYAYNRARRAGYQPKAPNPAPPASAPAAPLPAATTVQAPSPGAAAAAMTLGSGGAPTDVSPTDDNDPMPEFGQALREAFGRR